jgi:hypothetical protein
MRTLDEIVAEARDTLAQSIANELWREFEINTSAWDKVIARACREWAKQVMLEALR